MHDNAKGLRGIWHFSLRELFLVILAFAAFLGWGQSLYQRYRRFSPTPFFQETSDLKGRLAKIRIDLGEPATDEWSAAGTGSSTRASVHRDFAYEFPLSRASNDAYANSLQRWFRAEIAASGCTHMRGGSAGLGNECQFTLPYQRGDVTGVVHAYLRRKDDETAKLLVIQYENRAWQ